MADPLASVSTGQPIAIRAEAWNAIVASARAHQQGRRVQPGKGAPLPGAVVVDVLNDSGADIREYKPLAVTGAGGYDLGNDTAAQDWERRPLFTGGVPAAATDFVVITLDAIPDGGIGRAVISGPALCDIDSASGAAWAKPQAGDSSALLGTATAGTVRVLSVPASGGSQRRCAVYLHERPGQVELCSVTPSVRKFVVGVDFVTPKVRYRDRTIDANGCETWGEPYCEDGLTCDPAEDVEYYCIDGVCWAYYDGIVPDAYDAGPFATPELCDAGCPLVALELTGCCTGQSYTVLYLTLSSGPVVTLTSDGTNFVGSQALTGCTVSFTFDPTNCTLTYTAPGAPSVGSTCSGGCVATCGPPFSMGTFRVQSALLTGSACSFGNLTGVVSE